MIPHNRPQILERDRAAVDAVLSSGWIAQGPAVERLEGQFVAMFEGGAACAVSSGTAALYLGLKALGCGRGSSVAVPSYSCSALLNAVLMSGATPRVVDVQADTFCLGAETVCAQARDTQFVVAVHTFGAAADIASLKSRGYRVIEDCCQSLGGASRESPLGAQGDAAVFSFYATKIVTGGQGGLVWSAARDIIAAVRDYRQFDGREDYAPRFNFQLTDIQAALAASQMERLDQIRARRAQIAQAYLDALPSGLTVQAGLNEAGRMVHRFVVCTPDRAVRDAMRAALADAEVACIVPVESAELLHRCLRLDPDAYPVAERLAATTLSLPVHMALSDAELAAVCRALRRFRP